ncbi:MAG: GTP-binding protein [Caldilineaceae bacterium SB0662_bin_25]|nr:GTP-binding protein [Caldilineaceae bacterium SB0662_bin_25]
MNPISDLQPIPVTIITGFLGSGKTTLLNRILHAEHGLRVAVLVNDFGAINIDTQLVVGMEEDTISLANGCICCTIRGDFLKATRDLIQRPQPPEYILVETSGVSDPLEVAQTFRAIQRVQIDSILTVMDAEQILSLDKRHEVLSIHQIGMADIVILNKIDLVNEVQLQSVRDFIRQIVPQARIIETTHADVPLELLLNVGQFEIERLASRQPHDIHVHAEDEEHEHEDSEHHHQHTDHTLVFSTWSWRSSQPVSFRALQRMVNRLPETIYRAKGIFFLDDAADQKGVLHVVGRRASLTLTQDGWENAAPHSQLVVIGAEGSVDGDDLNQRMESCLAVNAPKSEREYITRTVIEWLRHRLPGTS